MCPDPDPFATTWDGGASMAARLAEDARHAAELRAAQEAERARQLQEDIRRKQEDDDMYYLLIHR